MNEPAEVSGAREGITLERYAEIRAHLRHREGEGESRVLSSLGVDRPRWGAANAAWMKALDEDADGPGELVVEFATAFAEARRRLKDDVPATLEAPAGLQPIAPQPAFSPPIASIPIAPPITPPPIAPPRIALPPIAPADPDPVDPNAETGAIRVDVRKLPTLPFAPGAAPPVISQAAEPRADAAVAMPKVNRAPAKLTGTANVDPRAIAAAVMPFDKGKPPTAPATPVPLPARPAPDAHLAAGAVPALTLEQYASLTAELTVSPERAAEIRARYQVGAEDVFQRLVRGFQARFAADAELKARVVALSAQYREWLLQKKSG